MDAQLKQLKEQVVNSALDQNEMEEILQKNMYELALHQKELQ